MSDRNIAAFYTIGFRELIPIYPLYAIMFGEHGITPLELSILFTLWAMVALIVEVPSGALADKYSRKWLIVASAFLKSGCFLSWYFWQDFSGYLLGFVLWGIGSALKSGAWEALLFDILKAGDQTSQFGKHYARINSTAMICIGTGELLGGLLIIQGYDFVLLISAGIPLLVIIPFVFFVHDVRKQEEVYEAGYLAMLQSGFKESYSNLTVRYVILIYGLLLIIHGIYDEYTGPFLKENGYSLEWIAYLGAGIFFCQAAGMAAAARWQNQRQERLLLLMAISGLCLFGAVWLSGWWVPVMLGLFFGLYGFAGTSMGTILQHAIDSEARATVTSVAGLAEGIGAMLGFMAFGLVAEQYQMTGGTLATAAATLVMVLFFSWLQRKWLIRQPSHSA